MTENKQERKTAGEKLLAYSKTELPATRERILEYVKDIHMDHAIWKDIALEAMLLYSEQEVKLALAEKEKEIETLKERLENSYKSIDITFMQMRDLVNSNLEKEKRMDDLNFEIEAKESTLGLMHKERNEMDERIKALEGKLKNLVDATQDKNGQFRAWHQHLKEMTNEGAAILKQ